VRRETGKEYVVKDPMGVWVAKAKSEGRYKGRAPTARRQGEKILALAGQGWTRAGIAEELGVSESSVYRVLAVKLGRAVTARQQ
jgi:DNA invertase Pin-like site-specific DNA recombinase